MGHSYNIDIFLTYDLGIIIPVMYSKELKIHPYPHKICTWALNHVGGTKVPHITKQTRNVKHGDFFSMEEIKKKISVSPARRLGVDFG